MTINKRKYISTILILSLSILCCAYSTVFASTIVNPSEPTSSNDVIDTRQVAWYSDNYYYIDYIDENNLIIARIVYSLEKYPYVKAYDKNGGAQYLIYDTEGE